MQPPRHLMTLKIVRMTSRPRIPEGVLSPTKVLARGAPPRPLSMFTRKAAPLPATSIYRVGVFVPLTCPPTHLPTYPTCLTLPICTPTRLPTSAHQADSSNPSAAATLRFIPPAPTPTHAHALLRLPLFLFAPLPLPPFTPCNPPLPPHPPSPSPLPNRLLLSSSPPNLLLFPLLTLIPYSSS